MSPLGHVLLPCLQESADRFAELTQTDSIRVRFDKVKDDGCRRFHIDNMTIRLLCTYIGPSTQWLHRNDIQRVNVQGDRYEEESIQHLPYLSVGLLKEHKHPTSGRIIYHRSPPIAEAGLKRFVLCLDEGSR